MSLKVPPFGTVTYKNFASFVTCEDSHQYNLVFS